MTVSNKKYKDIIEVRMADLTLTVQIVLRELQDTEVFTDLINKMGFLSR